MKDDMWIMMTTNDRGKRWFQGLSMRARRALGDASTLSHLWINKRNLREMADRQELQSLLLRQNGCGEKTVHEILAAVGVRLPAVPKPSVKPQPVRRAGGFVKGGR